MEDTKFKKCILKSRNYKYCNVDLPHNAPVIVGRGRETRIRDRRCSKNQVEITANLENGFATVVQLGENPSEVDDTLLLHQGSVTVCNGASINLLKNHLQYTLEFSINSEAEDVAIPSTSNQTTIATNSENGQYAATRTVSPPTKKFKSTEETITDELQSVRNSVVNDLQNLTTEDRWEEYDSSKLLVYSSAGLRSKPLIAAFDMDHTIIKTKSGKVFPTSSDDWCIMYPEIPGKLKEMNQKGYKIVIFTNQKGISQGRTFVPHFKRKIETIARKLGVPLQAFISTGYGNYRKPLTGMWDYLTKKANQGVSVDVSSSIYVGDAAGRIENWVPKKKKDFSCADRLFALNIRVKFLTPEEFFMGQKPAKFQMPSFDPREVGQLPLAVRYRPVSNDSHIPVENLISTATELVLCVGFPASGKTHFVQNYLIPKRYHHINRDTLGTWQKCIAECSKVLGQGRSVVIDNTNADAQTRAKYLECGKRLNLPSRCFLFNCTLEQAKHNNRFRQLTHTDAKHVGVTDTILHHYKNKFEEPTLQEGFSEIIKINFVPKFKTPQEESLYKMFLAEK